MLICFLNRRGKTRKRFKLESNKPYVYAICYEDKDHIMKSFIQECYRLEYIF